MHKMSLFWVKPNSCLTVQGMSAPGGWTLIFIIMATLSVARLNPDKTAKAVLVSS